MAERVVSVRLQARVEGFTAGMRKAKASVDDLTKADVPKATKAYGDLANKAALAGTAIAVGLGAAIKRFADFDEAMSAVRANSGATGAELEQLRAAAIQLGADSQFSATEAAQGINELAKAGVNSQAILSGGLKGALDLAAAGQIEVAQAAETTASALTQFNLSGAESVHVADLLTNGANKAQGGVLDLGMALKQAGLVAAGTGLSIEETTAGLTAFAAAGLIGSDAGTSFKTMLQRLSAPSDEAKSIMSELGISAYDAQGNFVGLASVAGQLQEGLQELTPAQRDSALATIFGSDAVRAARVLYTEGAQGIRDWTVAVSEQGAAAKQAATLTDNLNGDLERLGGALDSAFIQTGSAANGGLRTLVQGLTDVVDTVGKVPGPVLLAGTALAGIVLALPKGLKVYRDFTGSLDSVGLSMDKLSSKAPRTATALRGVGASIKGLAAALVAYSAADAAFSSSATIGGTDTFLKSLQERGDAVKAYDDILAQFAANNHGALSVNEIDSLDAAFKSLFDPTWDDKVDSFVGGVARVVGATDDSRINRSKEAIADLDSKLAELVASGNSQAASSAFDQYVNAAGKFGASSDDLMAMLPAYANALAGVDNGARDAASGTSVMTGATEDAEAAAEKAKQAFDDLKAAIEGLGSPFVQQRAATRDYEAAIDAATAALKENGKTLNVNTEEGRANQAALDEIQQATLAKVNADFEATRATKGVEEATKVATDTMKKGRQAFIDAATDAGMTKDQAKALADQLGLIPDNVKIQVSQSGAEAAGRAIANAAVDRTSTIWVTRRFRESDLLSEYQGVGGRALGGAVYGPGSGTSDTAGLYRLSNGEHILTAAEVLKMGGQSAVYAFRKALMTGQIPGRAQGGAVQYAPRVQVVQTAAPAGPQMTRSDYDQRIFIERLYATDERSFRQASQQRRDRAYTRNARAS